MIASFREQQEAYGFDTKKIGQMKQVAHGIGSVACTKAPIATKPVYMAPSLLKRADDSLMQYTGLSYTQLFSNLKRMVSSQPEGSSRPDGWGG